jgi:predicted  nucleic acid-binding Zn-ribbon protein
MDKDTFDFGFTFADENEVITDSVKYNSLTQEIDDLKSRIRKLDEMFLPFLQNLAKEPDKAMIKWPNRADVVNKQIAKMKQITNI